MARYLVTVIHHDLYWHLSDPTKTHEVEEWDEAFDPDHYRFVGGSYIRKNKCKIVRVLQADVLQVTRQEFHTGYGDGNYNGFGI